MRFRDFFQDSKKTVISFEVFPPKTDKGLEKLRATLPELLALQPDYMTVTYGAMGSTQSRTFEIAAYIKKEFGLETACHLTCVGASKSDLDGILRQIREHGIGNIVALRGDPPEGETSFTPPPDGCAYANELVEQIHAFERAEGSGAAEPFGIAVAGYPETHFEAPDMETDLRNLKRKVDAGVDTVVTQLFFDNTVFFRFVEKARKAGVRVPIVAGLMPVLSGPQIRRIAGMCGAKIPAELARQLDEAGGDNAKCEEIGVRWCSKQAAELLRRGVEGIHFYVLNRASHITRIMAALAR